MLRRKASKGDLRGKIFSHEVSAGMGRCFSFMLDFLWQHGWLTLLHPVSPETVVRASVNTTWQGQ